MYVYIHTYKRTADFKTKEKNGFVLHEEDSLLIIELNQITQS